MSRKTKFVKTAISMSVAAMFLTGCVATTGPTIPATVQASQALRDVPFHRPVRGPAFNATVDQIQAVPQNTTVGSTWPVAKDLNGDGLDEVIVTGRLWPTTKDSLGRWGEYYLNVFGWENGVLVNKNAEWFPLGDNNVYGSEQGPYFGDFTGNGKISVFMPPYSDYSDTNNSTNSKGQMFISNGTSFTKVEIPINAEVAGGFVRDMNNDGLDDMFMQTNMKSMIMFGNAASNFQVYSSNANTAGTSAIGADFMGNGQTSVIITEVGHANTQSISRPNALFSWSVDGSNNLVMTKITDLPTRRFMLPKWASYNFTGPHDVASLAYNFDNAGLTDAIIFSRPEFTNNEWPKHSEIQFLRNDGGGVFVDVTDTTLFNYNTSTLTTMHPVLVDVNNDGLMDIVAPTSEGTQVLIHTAEHKYMASYAEIIKAFQQQVDIIEKKIHNQFGGSDNQVAFVRGPDDQLYIVTTTRGVENGDLRKTLYVSKLGDTGVVTAQATVDALKQAWPWMSPAQVNETLAKSSIAWLNMSSIQMLDVDKLFKPIGEMKIITIDGSAQTLTGSISGVNVAGAVKDMKVFDQVGRDWTMDFGSTNQTSTNFWASRLSDAPTDDTRSIGDLKNIRSAYLGTDYGVLKIASDDKQEVTGYGLTNIKLSDSVRANVQFSNMPYSPFINMSGSWGEVKKSQMFEVSVSAKHDVFEAKAGWINSTTEIRKGLVTNVSPIQSVWAEAGYSDKTTKVFAGVFPKVISGKVDLSIPTSVDVNGKAQYTNTTASVSNPTVGYVRMQHTETLAKHKKLSFNAIATTNKDFAVGVKFEMRF